jgi:hypothetical protein
MVIHAEILQMFEAGTFDIAHLEPWLTEFAIAQEQWQLVSLPQTKTPKPEIAAPQAVCDVVIAAPPIS